jgi:hypothetical protein
MSSEEMGGKYETVTGHLAQHLTGGGGEKGYYITYENGKHISEKILNNNRAMGTINTKI